MAAIIFECGACQVEDKDADEDEADSPAQEASVAVDMLGAYAARSRPTALVHDEAGGALLECSINISRSTLVRQRLIDALASPEHALTGLRFTVFVGAPGAVDPAAVGCAHLSLAKLATARSDCSDDGAPRELGAAPTAWELPVLAAPGSNSAAVREIGRLTITVDGHAELHEIIALLRAHGGNAYRAEAAEARLARSAPRAGGSEARVIHVEVSELVLAGGSWYDAHAALPPPPSARNCWGACRVPVADGGTGARHAGCPVRRLNACTILLVSAVDMWTDIALCCVWLARGRVLWAALLLLCVTLAVCVTLVVTLHPIDERGSYAIPPAARTATMLCLGPPFAAARAAVCARGARGAHGAHDLAQDMHLTEALVEACPSTLLQAFALLHGGEGGGGARALLLASLGASVLSVTHAVGSDFELDSAAAVPLGLLAAEHARAFGRLSAAVLPTALCANAFGMLALAPVAVALLGLVAISRAHAWLDHGALERGEAREAHAQRWLGARTASELWLTGVEGSAAALALGYPSEWLAKQPLSWARRLGGLAAICLGVQLLAVAHVDGRIASALRPSNNGDRGARKARASVSGDPAAAGARRTTHDGLRCAAPSTRAHGTATGATDARKDGTLWQ
ncbi:hypothetical protein KFE25_005671 [Diacronema lutheri]|uniref:Uncharacterized protein n=1 Tax=Diacronema lutheri TaxID=2081491 RepID=A0A8J5XGU0_DIALT|nr:hypothetical protein KFE25_005671 [Diacronema lutheri]